MIIEVKGTGVHNKGAELLLRAIRDYFAENHPSVSLAVSHRFGSHADRGKYGLLTKITHKKPLKRVVLNCLLPKTFRDTHGLVRDQDVDAILDASGFAYGDQWGDRNCFLLAEESERWRRSGRKRVLLPQALGPFTRREAASAFRRALGHIDLVFARDRISYDHVCALVGESPKVRLAPDFTNLVSGLVPHHIVLPERFACIVPNLKMMTHTDASANGSYIRFLERSVLALEAEGVTPILLFHAPAGDGKVAGKLQELLGRRLATIEEDDPVYLKGILGNATVVIGSRFHALVGALSQGVPSVATSWSHKYEALFEEYGCERFVVAPSLSNQDVRGLVHEICDASVQVALRQGLKQHAMREKARALDMFHELEEVLGLRSA